MTNHGMLVCSFNFRGRFKKGDNVLCCLNQPHVIEQEDSSVTIDNAVEMFRLFCDANIDLTDDEKKKKVFSVKENSFNQFDTDTYSALAFVIKSGSYGIEADITDKNTNTVKYHKSADEPDVKEFLCVVYIPKDVGELQIKKGIFVFQSIGSFGVKTITTDMMRVFFADMKLTLETRSVSVSAFLEKLIEQGNLHKLTLIRDRVSPNNADNMLITTGREERAFIKPRFQQEWLQKMYAIFKKADQTGIIEIPDDQDFDDISIEFKLGERTRTVRLRNLERVSIVEDIPDHVIQKRSNQEIIQHMIKTADAYKDRMVWGEPGEV
mgnify:CR=1 FL=1